MRGLEKTSCEQYVEIVVALIGLKLSRGGLVFFDVGALMESCKLVWYICQLETVEAEYWKTNSFASLL